jgi:hypothetical protein
MKQAGLGFLSLTSRPVKVRQRVVHVASSRWSCEDQVKDGWVDAMGCVKPCYPYFAVFIVLGLSPINKTLEGCGSLPLLLLLFSFLIFIE